MPTHANFITEDTTIHGQVTTASSLTIAGVVEGNVTAGGEVLILGDAVVKGDVSGPDVRVLGRVEGRVTASGKLTIASSGNVSGDIVVRALLIEDGGVLDGMCTMGDSAKKAHSMGASLTGPSISMQPNGNHSKPAARAPESRPPLPATPKS